MCAVCHRSGKATLEMTGKGKLFNRADVSPDRLGMVELPKGWDLMRHKKKGIVLAGFICKACQSNPNYSLNKV